MSRLFRKIWFFIIASVLFLGAAGVLYSNGALADGSALVAALEGDVTPIHIAVVIPEKQDDTYPEVENVGKMFEQQVNANGGVNGHPIQVDFYLDGNDKVDEAQAQALKIVEEGRALVVIGHRNSAASEAKAPIYEEAGIPRINSGASAPGVTKDHPWSFRVINNTNDLGKYAALYAHDVLGYETASVIHLTDDFGTSLAESFMSTFEERGGTIVYEKSMERVSEVGEKEIQAGGRTADPRQRQGKYDRGGEMHAGGSYTVGPLVAPGAST